MKLEHVIGKDGLHRLRLTSEQNGQIFDNSHEGFSSHHEAWQNLKRKLMAYLTLGGIDARLAEDMAIRIVHNIDANDIPIVDERVQDPLEALNPDPGQLNRDSDFQANRRAEISSSPVARVS